MAPSSLDAVIIAAPDGVIERRFIIAAALLALKPGGRLEIMAAKDRGGSRLAKELAEFGCAPIENYGRGWRICHVTRPETVIEIEPALKAGSLQQAPGLGWTQPGVFSWNRIDPGSALLAPHLKDFSGQGADLGCGAGYLAGPVLASPAVTGLLMVDIDRRAIAAAKANVQDPRARFEWADILTLEPPAALNFVVMNPPFHDAGAEDKALGIAFIRRASSMLRKGGLLKMVANRHLPYEAVLDEAFSRWTALADTAGFKLIEAVK
ncbi:MAG: methyltransferase [Caulobacteraceae bacterium]|nr:methyltransferase [Caulobacteraceae bacterium]